MDNNKLNKKNILKRGHQLFDSSISFRWDNFIIELSAFILIYLFLTTTGYIGLESITSFTLFTDPSDNYNLFIKQFFILEIFIILFMLRKIPLKAMSKQVIIFAIFISLISLTTFTIRISYLLYAVFTLIWVIIFIITQQYDDLSAIGAFTLISYVYSPSMILRLKDCNLETIITLTMLSFLIVIITAIPMIIIRLLQHDPYKKELIASLFKKENTYHDFNKIKNTILKIDQSKYTKSIINIAEDLFNYNINLTTLSFNLDHKEKIDQFTEEINRLIEKIRFAIINSLEGWFEINIGRIMEFYKDIDYEVQSNKKNLNQSFLNYMAKQYKNTFEKLNDVFAGKVFNDEIEYNIQSKSFTDVIKNINSDNIKFRYSLRFVIVLLISFIWDYTNHNYMYTTTLLSFFTLTTNLIFNSEVFLIRTYATVMAVIIGLGILITFDFFNLTYIIPIISLISFALFFIFKDNGYRACLMFLLGFILWIPQDTVNTTILFTVDTILSLIIIIVVSNIIMPKTSETNIIKLLKLKCDYIKKSVQEFYTPGLEENTFEQLRKNNIEISKIITKLDKKYEDIDKELELFNNLNQLLEEYRSKIITIGLILNKEEMEYDYKSIIYETELMVNAFKNSLDGKDMDIRYKSISHNIKKDIIKNEEINFIYPILMSIILDADEITRILTQIKDKELYKKYNENLIKNIFNIKDIAHMIDHT